MSKKNVGKSNTNVGYIQNIASNELELNQFVFQYLKPLLHNGLGTILKNVKSKGFSSFNILAFLTLLPYLGLASINSFYQSDFSGLLHIAKDTLYRFKNNSYIPWRKILYSINRRFSKVAANQEIAKEIEEKPTCLIFDDTDVKKVGYLIEGVSKIWSHSQHSYILGFKLLVCHFFDGISSRPLDFSLHREQQDKTQQYGLKKEIREKQYQKKRSEDSASKYRKEELDEKKTTMVLKMIAQAIKEGFKAQYALTDSWFFCQNLLKFVKEKGMDLISGVKMGRLTFIYNGKSYSPKALLAITKHKAKFDRKLRMHYIPLIVSYQGIKIQLFFVRYGQQEKWRIIICSDMKLSFSIVMEIYQIRWSIEVFFKEIKQYLGLQKCQSRDFDAHVAYITLAMISYLALALKKRVETHLSIGELFRGAKSELLELTIAQKVWKWFVQIIMEFTNLFDCEPKVIFQKLTEPKYSKMFNIQFLE